MNTKQRQHRMEIIKSFLIEKGWVFDKQGNYKKSINDGDYKKSNRHPSENNSCHSL